MAAACANRTEASVKLPYSTSLEMAAPRVPNMQRTLTKASGLKMAAPALSKSELGTVFHRIWNSTSSGGLEPQGH